MIEAKQLKGDTIIYFSTLNFENHQKANFKDFFIFNLFLTTNHVADLKLFLSFKNILLYLCFIIRVIIIHQDLSIAINLKSHQY